MAKFQATLPDEVIADIERLSRDYKKIFGEMTRAGAEAAYNIIRSNLPSGIASSQMASCLQITRVYETPTDDGINTKVAFYGYFKNDKGQRVPAPLVANVFEFGRDGKPFTKHPFMRKSFKDKAIERAMLEAQSRVSGGLLDE